MDQEKIDEGKALIKEIVSVNYPEVDTRKGTVVYDLLIGLAALGYGYLAEFTDSFAKTNSLKLIAENPDDIDDATIDAILANWFTTRDQGSYVSGRVKITVNTRQDYFLAANTVFIVNDLNYYLQEDTTVESGDLLEEDGNYYFTIEVRAENVGSSYNVFAGTIFTTIVFPLNITSVTALHDFSTGRNKETSEDLLARANESITSRDFVSRKSINALIKDNFSSIGRVFVTGHNDREMQRDVNNIGIKGGAKDDIFVRGTSPLTKTLELSTDSGGKATINGANVPILRARRYALKTVPDKYYDIGAVEIGSSKNISPHLTRFSIYEKIIIDTVFADNTVLVDVEYEPDISDIHSFATDDETKVVVCDTLVRSFMPCFITATIEYYVEDDKVVDQDAFLSAILSFINNYQDDDGIFYLSRFYNMLQEYANIKAIKFPMDVSALYYLPDGTITEVQSQDRLEIDPDYSLGYSNRTFSFFSTSFDIALVELEQ